MKKLAKVNKLVIKYSPEILTGIGIMSTGAAVVLSGKAALKVDSIFEKQEKPLDIKDKIKLSWKEYVPTGLAYTIGITALIGSNRVSASRVATVAGLYALSESNFATYKDKVKEIVSKKTVGTIKESISQDKVTNNPPTENNTEKIVVTNSTHDTVLCMDEWSGRYFESNMEHIRHAANNVNEEIYKGFMNYCSVNDLYRELGIPEVKSGEDFGWDGDNNLKIEFDTVLTPDGKPCIVMKYDIYPSDKIKRYY